MEIIVSKFNGFCFGVKKAIDTAKSLSGDKVFILGEIIHNDTVVKDLETLGLKTVDDIEKIEQGTVLIRTHGVPKSVIDTAEEKGLKIVDCTCPFVKEIQNIVRKYHNEGFKIVIIGDDKHPEVIGINGWCENSALITKDPKEINALTEKKVCIVVQTTFSDEKYQEILKKIEKSGSKTVEIFKTICYTTMGRQKDADNLSKTCDAMIVLGGKNSNNTNKLYEICKQNCDNVFRLFSPLDLDKKEIRKFSKVGIVSGASTPYEQTQEVILNMDNNTEVKTSQITEETVSEKVETNGSLMADAMAKMDNKSQKFRVGQVISATISAANDDGLALYIPNTKKEIVLSKDELACESYDKTAYADKVGEEIKVMIIALNPVVLSEKAMVKLAEEEAEIEEIANGKIFSVTITASNKGGLTSKFGSYQVFIPSSQIRIGFVNDLDKYIGKTLRVKAEKVENTGRKQIVASQRVVLEAEKAEREAARAEKEEAFFSAIEVGDVVKGTAQRFSAFGAFISVNGFDCLAHISDLAWNGCNNPADVLELNKTYEFKVLKIDKENKKVSLGYKQLQPKPWDTVAERYNVGDTVKGKVVRIVTFGAFVEVEKEIDGLVHVSQITHEWLENPTSVLKVGDEVEAKILDIDPEKEKMTLSIKALLPEPENAKKPAKKETDGEEKPRKKAKAAKAADDEDLSTWSDSPNGGISIAELLKKDEE